jgi:hypothetical protein
MRLDPDPKLTKSNQNSEFWIGSGSNRTNNMVWIRGGTEKNPTGYFALDLIKFGPAVAMLLEHLFAQKHTGFSQNFGTRGETL